MSLGETRGPGGGSPGGSGGASQHGFEVERLKRKDLSKWDDGDTAGRRRRRISTRDGEACEY